MCTTTVTNGQPHNSTSTDESQQDEKSLFNDAFADVVPLEKNRGRVTPAPNRKATQIGSSENENVDFTADEHFDLRYSDQFIRGRVSSVSRITLEKLERGEFAVRSHVDLHGMALEDARYAVDSFLAECQRKAERCVLVITGKGRNSPGQLGVLREKIPEWLACGPSARRVLAFVTARPCDGGEGALYVFLRERPSRKTRIEVESGGGR